MTTPRVPTSPTSRLPLIATAAAGVIFTILGALLNGSKGFVAGLLGAIVVVAFFGIGQYVVERVLDRNPQVAMMAALLTFVVQILILFVLLVLLRDVSWLDGRWFGYTVFAGIIVWTVTSMVDYSRNRRLTVIPGSGPGHPDGPIDPPLGP